MAWRSPADGSLTHMTLSYMCVFVFMCVGVCGEVAAQTLVCTLRAWSAIAQHLVCTLRVRSGDRLHLCFVLCARGVVTVSSVC